MPEDDTPTVCLVTVDYPPSVGGKQRLLSTVYGDMENTRVVHPGRFPRALFTYGFPLVAVYVLIRVLWDGTDVLVCGQILPDGIIARLVSTITGVPYVVYAHDSIDTTGERERGGIIGWLHTKSCAGASQFIAVSRYTKRLLEDLGIEPGRVTVINPPVDTDAFQDRGWHYYGDDTVVVLTVSRLTERKNVRDVLTILDDIAAETEQEVVYHVVGDGPKRDDLEAYADTLDLRTVFTGNVSFRRLLKQYTGSDLFVLKSDLMEEQHKSEGFGIVYTEASACGLPVIGSDHSGIRDAIKDGETGYRVGTDDELRERLEELVRADKIREDLGRAGRKFVEERLKSRVIQGEAGSCLNRVVAGDM